MRDENNFRSIAEPFLWYFFTMQADRFAYVKSRPRQSEYLLVFTDIVPIRYNKCSKNNWYSGNNAYYSPVLSLGIIATITVIEIVQNRFYRNQRSFTVNLMFALCCSANSVHFRCNEWTESSKILCPTARYGKIERYRVKKYRRFRNKF